MLKKKRQGKAYGLYQTDDRDDGAAAEVLAAALSHISPYCQIDDPGDVALLTSAPSPRWDYLGEELFENQGRAPTVTFYFEQGEQGPPAAAGSRGRRAGAAPRR